MTFSSHFIYGKVMNRDILIAIQYFSKTYNFNYHFWDTPQRCLV